MTFGNLTEILFIDTHVIIEAAGECSYDGKLGQMPFSTFLYLKDAEIQHVVPENGEFFGTLRVVLKKDGE